MKVTSIVTRKMSEQAFIELNFLCIGLTIWIWMKIGGRHEITELIVEICFVIGIICYMYFNRETTGYQV